MRLQHTSVVRMLSYANDKCQTMGQLCKEFFHQQRQKKLQPLNKFSNNSLLDRTVFTCRTGTKFPYGKNHPTAHPGSSAGGWKGGSLGVGPGDTVSGSCFLSTPSQLQMSSPGCGKMAESSSCLDGWAPDPAWEKSCSWALVTPLTTKQYHSASENKICIYVTSPSSPALPSRDSRGSMLQTRSNSSGLLVTSEHLLGRNHSACPW